MKKLPKIINQEEFELLIKAVDKTKRISAKSKKQYKIAMVLGFEAGMRISEIVGYRKAGVQIIPPLTKEMFDDTGIRLTGKGQKDRVVTRPKRINEAALNVLPLKIKRRALQNFVTKLGWDVLHRLITFHTLRHGFGSHLAGLNVPLHMIQQQMGHSRLDTTGIYLHANPKEALEKVRELF